MGRWTDVGGLDEFADGVLRLVEVGKQEVCVLRLDDEVFALRNSCPHAGAKMCVGRVMPRLVADSASPGSAEVVPRQRVLGCPWHGWEFDPRDGRGIADPRMRLKIWPTRVDDGRVLVGL
jgi:nitrite reductase (NADH) small subunit